MTAAEDPEDSALSPEWLDAVDEAVVTAEDAQTRAEVITDLINEVEQAVRWRHLGRGRDEEDQSMHELVEAAREHQDQMARLAGEPSDGAGEPSDEAGGASDRAGEADERS